MSPYAHSIRLTGWIGLLLLGHIALRSNAQPGYIQLQGDQFIDEHGMPFFPMVMNYYVDYYYSGTPGSFPTNPTTSEIGGLSFGRSSLWSCSGPFNYPFNQGTQRLLQDLGEIKAQGFNTIRLLSIATKKTGSPGFGVTAKHHNSGQDPVYMNMDPPYIPDQATNPVVWYHFNTILAVCSLANTLDLKVIVEPVLGGELIASEAGDATNADHVALLEAFATFIAGSQVHNLLAYEFYGEPTFADQDLGVHHTKAEICDLAGTWTSAIRAHDPDHLVTLGSVYHTDLMYEGWDPMLLDIDFATIHVYPQVDDWEWQQDPATYLTAATERYMNMFRFYDAYLRKPYIVTETGFSGEDPFEACSAVPNPWIGYPYTCWGDESDQNDFLEATYAGIRDSRCAGYGWWIFMNMHWLPEPNAVNVTTLPLIAWKERYFGILRFGDPVDIPGTTGWEGSRKLAAQTLADYVMNPPPPAPPAAIPTTLDMNDRYYNQYMHPPNSVTYDNPNVSGAPNQYGTLTGRVVDAATGGPIAGAVIHANNSTHKEVILGIPYYRIRAYVTYTDVDGWFSLRALDPRPGPGFESGNPDDLSGMSDWTIKDIKITGYVSEQVHVLDHFEQGVTYEVNTLQPRIDRILESEHVPQATTEHFDALATLTVTDVLIEGTSDLKARYDVHLTDGFHAAQGSETHIYTEPVYFTCTEVYDADLKSLTGLSSNQPAERQATQRQLKLQFALPAAEFSMDLHPNPTSGFISCQVNSASSEVTSINFRLLNASGQEVMHEEGVAIRFQLDLNDLAPGVYSLKVSMGSRSTERTLIKQ